MSLPSSWIGFDSLQTHHIALVAQGIEHPPSKRMVAGSNPAKRANIYYNNIIGFRV